MPCTRLPDRTQLHRHPSPGTHWRFHAWQRRQDDNDALESDINASIDYNALYDTAVNELGMVYPGKDQVITYNSKESEYVKQYKDVPDAN